MDENKQDISDQNLPEQYFSDQDAPEQNDPDQDLPGQDGQNETPKEPLNLARELFDWAQSLVNAIVAIVMIFAFAASVYSVQQTSMDNTLEAGQHLMISNLFYTPQRGDIIMFTKYDYKHNGAETSSPLVKRIIALAGDEIKFEFEDGSDYGTLYIKYGGEGEFIAQNEPYIREPMRVWCIRDPMPTQLVVPEGCVFVMGDNRNISKDSRSTEIGFVDERYILGRVLLRLTPFSKFGSVE